MKNLFNYIFPFRCLGCHRILTSKHMPLCMKCYNQLSFSHEQLDRDTLTAEPLLQHKQLVGAASIVNYMYGNVAQKLMHANKYYNQPHIGLFMAQLALPKLKNIFVDAITIVPSHKRTLMERGYNQVEIFAHTIAKALDTPFYPDLLLRNKRVTSQTHRNRKQRMESLVDAFAIKEEAGSFDSILIIDDVMTTGATLNVCLSVIQRQSNIKIYVLVMARAI